MGWDYHTYQEQPLFFIEQIATFLGYEVTAQKAWQQELEQKSRTAKP